MFKNLFKRKNEIKRYIDVDDMKINVYFYKNSPEYIHVWTINKLYIFNFSFLNEVLCEFIDPINYLAEINKLRTIDSFITNEAKNNKIDTIILKNKWIGETKIYPTEIKNIYGVETHDDIYPLQFCYKKFKKSGGCFYFKGNMEDLFDILKPYIELAIKEQDDKFHEENKIKIRKRIYEKETKKIQKEKLLNEADDLYFKQLYKI